MEWKDFFKSDPIVKKVVVTTDGEVGTYEVTGNRQLIRVREESKGHVIEILIVTN